MSGKIGTGLAAMVIGLGLMVAAAVWAVAPIQANGGGSCGTVLRAVDDPGGDFLSTSGCSSAVDGLRFQTITIGLLGVAAVVAGGVVVNNAGARDEF